LKVGGRKSSTPLGKAATRGDDGGKSKTNSTSKTSTQGGGVGRNNEGHDKVSVTVRDNGRDKAVGTVHDKDNSIYRSVDGDVNKTNNPADNVGAVNTTYKLADNGDRNAGGGVKSSTNSGTIEVRFMIDINRRRDFNLCMRLREFIVEARAMDPTFSILPLGGNRVDMITKHEE
jgi:hypothetical protein